MTTQTSQSWDTKDTRTIYHRFDRSVSIIDELEKLAKAEGIREAAVVSCIGSLTQLKLRNLCGHEEGGDAIFERRTVDENLELISAEGYVQPLPDGEVRVHIHLVAAFPSGETVGGHCEDATTYTGAFMYMQILDEE